MRRTNGLNDSGFETSKKICRSGSFFIWVQKENNKKNGSAYFPQYLHVSLVFLLKFFCPILISIETWDSHL